MLQWTRNLEYFYAEHSVELNAALIYAALFALILEFLKPASLRRIKNKLAEKSVERLQKRIAQLERQRHILHSWADKAIYLQVLRTIIAMLVYFGFAAVLLLMHNRGFVENGDIGAMCAIAFTIGIGAKALRLSDWDADEQFANSLAKLDKTISALQMKLRKRTQ